MHSLMIMRKVILLCIMVAVASATIIMPLESDDIINHVNNAQTTWKAGRNFNSKLTKSYTKNLLGLNPKNRPNILPLKQIVEVGEIPESFDARKQWPYCKSLQELRDQGNCGSCWAVAAAATLTDRFCIATEGKWNGHLSAEDLLTCCHKCGNGCNGGWDDQAWRYFKKTGIVTGGDYGSEEGCQPYKKRPCEHHVNGTRVQCSSLGKKMITPKCSKKCITKTLQYKQDHKKVKRAYRITKNEKQIQQDIMTHGPLEAAFEVYEDFISYKSGVYQHITGKQEGGHAVKVIGWGVENNVSYWLVANSWNSDWGDGGFFKIKRGTNEVGFEEDMSGGVPKV